MLSILFNPFSASDPLDIFYTSIYNSNIFPITIMIFKANTIIST